MGYKCKSKAVARMTNTHGKGVGLMVEGSSAHMDAMAMMANEKLMDNPDIKMGGDIIDETAQNSSLPMDHESPVEMDHESPATFTGMSGGSAMHMSPYKLTKKY